MPNSQNAPSRAPSPLPENHSKEAIERSMQMSSDEIRNDTRSQLNELVAQISGSRSGPNIDRLVKALRDDNISYKEWREHPIDGKSKREMRRYLPRGPGLDILIDYLDKQPIGSEERREAEQTLDRIITILDQREQSLIESDQKLKEVHEDAATGTITNTLNTIVANFKRGSGVEKVASLAAIGIGLYLLHLTYQTKTGKGLIRFGIGALAVNILTRLATGKSLLEHLGVWQAKESISPEIRRLAEKVHIADNPQKLKALAKLGSMDMREMYQLYMESHGSIDPINVGIFDNSLTGIEIYNIMDALIVKAGNGDKTAGQQFIKKTFLRGDRPWNFFEASMMLFSNEGIKTLAEAEAGIMDSELKTIFSGYEDYGLLINKTDLSISILGCPMYDVRRVEHEKNNPIYVFEVDRGAGTVRIPLRQSSTERKESIVDLQKAIEKKIKNHLPDDPKYKNATIEREGSKLYLKNFDIDGKKCDLEVAFNNTDPEKPVVSLLYNGVVLKTFTSISSNENISQKDIEKAELSSKVKDAVSILRGLDVRVTLVTDNPLDSRYKHIRGEIVGDNLASVPFEAYMDKDSGIIRLYKRIVQSLLCNETFIARKKSQAEKELAPKIEALKNIIHDVPERIFRLTAIYKGVSGSVRENLFIATADAKMRELISIYEHMMHQAKTTDEAQVAWNNMISKSAHELGDLYNSLLEAARDNRKFSDDDFKAALDRLDTIGYASKEMQDLMVKIRENMLKRDYTGLDKSDITDTAVRIYKAARDVVNYFTKEFASSQTLSENQSNYLNYLKNIVITKLAEIQFKDTGILGTGLKKTIDTSNFPSSIDAWGIQTYSQWLASNPHKREAIDPKLLNKQIADSLNQIRNQVIIDARANGYSDEHINSILEFYHGNSENGYLGYNNLIRDIAKQDTEEKRNQKISEHEIQLRKFFEYPIKIKR